MKVGGRLKHANNQRNRSFFRQSTMSDLLLFNITGRDHSGRHQTLLIPQSYWIVNGKSAVRKILQRCLYCERMRVQPQPSIMANLPDERIGLSKTAFSYTGMDFFEPLLLNIRSVQEQHNLGSNVLLQFLFA